LGRGIYSEHEEKGGGLRGGKWAGDSHRDLGEEGIILREEIRGLGLIEKSIQKKKQQ